MEPQLRKYRPPSPERKKKVDRILNYLIVFMVLLIAISMTLIIKNIGGDEAAPEPEQQAPIEESVAKEEAETSTPTTPAKEQETTQDKAQEDEPKISTTTSDDPIVDEVIIDSSWQPLKTAQTTTQHTSSYEVGSLDWDEKVALLSEVTGLQQSSMIIIRIGNNGSTQKSFGVVTSPDGVEKYRVSMEWVDNEGWLATQLEKLNTTVGSY